jgi:hypothetical protein
MHSFMALTSSTTHEFMKVEKLQYLKVQPSTHRDKGNGKRPTQKQPTAQPQPRPFHSLDSLCAHHCALRFTPAIACAHLSRLPPLLTPNHTHSNHHRSLLTPRSPLPHHPGLLRVLVPLL